MISKKFLFDKVFDVEHQLKLIKNCLENSILQAKSEIYNDMQNFIDSNNARIIENYNELFFMIKDLRNDLTVKIDSHIEQTKLDFRKLANFLEVESVDGELTKIKKCKACKQKIEEK